MRKMLTPSLVGTALLGAMLLAATPARAQCPLDTVELTSGGFVRGTILEYQPQGGLVIDLPTGERRALRPTEIASVHRAESTVGQRLVAPQLRRAPVPSRLGGEAVIANEGIAYSRVHDSAPSSESTVGVRVNLGFAWCDACQDGGLLMGDVGGYLDLRPDLGSYRIRLELALGFAAWNDFAVIPEVRLYPFGWDLSDWLTVRIGSGVGLVWLESFGSVGSVFTPAAELAVMLADRQVEVGLHGGVPIFVEYPSPAVDNFVTVLAQAYVAAAIE
ncbi:MAG: hypothetical protein AB7S26_33735 [Sandaracinaceae bacterium]